jgi:hypothetical protein
MPPPEGNIHDIATALAASMEKMKAKERPPVPEGGAVVLRAPKALPEPSPEPPKGLPKMPLPPEFSPAVADLVARFEEPHHDQGLPWHEVTQEAKEACIAAIESKVLDIRGRAATPQDWAALLWKVGIGTGNTPTGPAFKAAVRNIYEALHPVPICAVVAIKQEAMCLKFFPKPHDLKERLAFYIRKHAAKDAAVRAIANAKVALTRRQLVSEEERQAIREAAARYRAEGGAGGGRGGSVFNSRAEREARNARFARPATHEEDRAFVYGKLKVEIAALRQGQSRGGLRGMQELRQELGQRIGRVRAIALKWRLEAKVLYEAGKVAEAKEMVAGFRKDELGWLYERGARR